MGRQLTLPVGIVGRVRRVGRVGKEEDLPPVLPGEVAAVGRRKGEQSEALRILGSDRARVNLSVEVKLKCPIGHIIAQQ